MRASSSASSPSSSRWGAPESFFFRRVESSDVREGRRDRSSVVVVVVVVVAVVVVAVAVAVAVVVVRRRLRL
jgi:hypothetical protein